jgi:2-haloacid dehalogenase
MPVPIRAVAFDLLTALIDSWSLWIDIAEDEAKGRAWRSASLRLVTMAGGYRPYEELVVDATRKIGLPIERANSLVARWGELRPWPEAKIVLQRVQRIGLPMVVVTNCSHRLAEQTALATGIKFDLVMSAERAGVYKTDPRAYRAALDWLGLAGPEVLFVAGSAHDVPGAGAVAMPVYWSNRQALPVPDFAPAPVVDALDLEQLPKTVASLASAAPTNRKSH